MHHEGMQLSLKLSSYIQGNFQWSLGLSLGKVVGKSLRTTLNHILLDTVRRTFHVTSYKLTHVVVSIGH